MNALIPTTFIRASEIWVPTADGSMLEFGGGLYREAPRLGAVSAPLCFGRGEGLPGQAWEQGTPVLINQWEGSGFRRTAAAKAAGLRCALAIPIFANEVLRAVVVFFCGSSQTHAGAIELWRNKARVTPDMTLVDGYYGTQIGEPASPLETLSREAFLPRGSGLPGMAWQQDATVFMADLSQSTHFLRAQAAAESGISRGLAIPCAVTTHDNYVVTFLSAATTPIARRVEIWAPDAANESMVRRFGFCDASGQLPLLADGLALGDYKATMSHSARTSWAATWGVIASACMSGVPQITEHAFDEPVVGASAKAAGLQSMLAMPVMSEGMVAEVLVLYF